MSGLFVGLFLGSLILLTWGLIAPHHFAKHTKNGEFTRKHAGFGFGFFAVVFFILVGVTAPPQKTVNVQQASLTTKTQAAAAKPNNNSTQSPTVTTEQQTQTQQIPFTTQNQNDGSLPKGQTKVIQQGQNGSETLTYKLTLTNGRQTDKTLLSTTVNTQPVNQIVAFGTFVTPAPTPTVVSKPKAVTNPVPAPAPAPSTGCHPLSNSGTCYRAGEYCRDTDHGVIGIASNGEAIICTYNNGWRWEPR